MSQHSQQTTGRFIVFEGIDGAGTTTQLARLLRRLGEDGIAAHGTAEPTTGPVGRLLRRLLAGEEAPFDPMGMALLFAADRRDHLAREILPHLAAGRHVLCDRYVLSSLVYQHAAGVPRDFVVQINAPALALRAPDLTLFLDVDAAVGAERRARRRGQADLYETDDTQRAVAAAYRAEAAAARALPAAAPVLILDGSGSEEEVAEAVWASARSCLLGQGTAGSS